MQDIPEWMLELRNLKRVIGSHLHSNFVALPDWITRWPLEELGIANSPAMKLLPEGLGSGAFATSIRKFALSFLGIQVIDPMTPCDVSI